MVMQALDEVKLFSDWIGVPNIIKHAPNTQRKYFDGIDFSGYKKGDVTPELTNASTLYLSEVQYISF